MDSITLVIPARSDAAHIAASRSTILAAASGDWELRSRVVDDGSTDATAAEIKTAIRRTR